MVLYLLQSLWTGTGVGLSLTFHLVSAQLASLSSPRPSPVQPYRCRYRSLGRSLWESL
jgi:hypothetical protein